LARLRNKGNWNGTGGARAISNLSTEEMSLGNFSVKVFPKL
jgi:hypothetical protein